MVFTRPMRAASQAAPRCENAFMTRAPKNSIPIVPSPAPKRSKKKYERSVAVRNPPPRLSSANSEQMRHSTRRVAEEIETVWGPVLPDAEPAGGAGEGGSPAASEP